MLAPRFRRLTAAVALAFAVAAGASGCGLITPQETTVDYDPADGVGVDLGDVLVRDALAGIGADGTLSLIFHVINVGDRSHDLRYSFRAGGGQVEGSIRVPAGGAYQVGLPDGTRIIVVDPEDAVLGGLFDVYFQAGDAPGVAIGLPVLDPVASPYLADLVP